MQIYTKYILKQLMQSCLIVCTVFTAIVWAVHTSNLMQLIVNKGIKISDFLKLSIYLLPYLNFTILPLGTLVASILVLNRFYLNKEILIFQSAGYSYLNIFKPFLIFGIIMTAITYCSSIYVMPKSYKKFKDLHFFLQNNYISALLNENEFSHYIPGVTIYVGKRLGHTTFSNTLIYDIRNPNRESTIIAKYAEFLRDNNAMSIIIKNGTNQQKIPQTKHISTMSFSSYVMQLDLNSEDIKKSIEPSERFILDLLHTPSGNPEFNMSIAHAHQRIVWPLFCFLFAALSFAISTKGNYNRESYWRKTVITIALSIALISANIAFHNLMLTYPSAVWLVYANIIFSIVFCITTSRRKVFTRHISFLTLE